MSQVRADIQRAGRSLRKQPGLTMAVVVTLALGIGANTAVFSFVWGILLRPFPYPQPEGLVRAFSVSQKDAGREGDNSLMDVADWGRASTTLSAIGGYTDFDTYLKGDGATQPIRMCQLNEGALRALGVSPLLGRLFLPEEDRPGGDVHKVLIGYGLWQSRFAGDPNILGRPLSTPLTTFTIIGVMPPGFGFPGRADAWSPMESWYAIQVGERRNKMRHHRDYRALARLRPGVSIEQASADLNGVAAGLEQQHPGENAGIRVRLRPLRETETGALRPYLTLVAAAAGFVLLICCFNVTGLLLSRAMVARREFAVRAALGASRWRLARTSLVEGGLLALAGGLLGVGLAYAAVRLLLRVILVPLPTWMRIEIDAPVLVFSSVVSLLSAFLAAAGAVLLVSRADLAHFLRDHTRSTAGGARFRQALVISQVALTLLLLIGAGLLSQTFLRLRHQETGFSTTGLLVARVANYRSGSRVETARALSQFHAQVLERLRGLPGVVSAGGANVLPYTRTTPDRLQGYLRVKGSADQETKLTVPVAGSDVSPGFLETLGVPLLSGRTIDRTDTAESPMVAIVNERAARTLWPGREAVGQELYWGIDDPTPENPYCRVAGVVGNVRYLAGEADDGIEIYYPYTQFPAANIYYVLRVAGDPLSIAPAVRETIRGVDRDAAVVYMKTMDALIDESLWQRRLWGVLVAAFGALSLALVAVGIYGLLSYFVAQRTREIGVRLALGAPARGIRAQVLGQGAILVVAGVALGLIAGLAFKRVLSSLVFGVSATDPGNLLGAVTVLIGVALVACYLPARRASAVNPIEALRDE